MAHNENQAMESLSSSPVYERFGKRFKEEMQRDPMVTFDEIGGYKDVKDCLKLYLDQTVHVTVSDSQQVPQPLLLYGEPGVGKTILLNAAVHAASLKLFVFNLYFLGSTAYEKHIVGIIEAVFQVAYTNAPCLLCLEDVEQVCREEPLYKRAEQELLLELQKYQESNSSGAGERSGPVVVVGVTQKPWLLTDEMKARFNLQHVDLPSKETSIAIVKLSLKETTHNLTDDDFTQLGEQMKGFTGAEITSLFRDACMDEVRTIQKAKFFKKISVPSNCGNKNKEDDKSDPSQDPSADAGRQQVAPSVKDLAQTKEVSGVSVTYKQQYVPCEENDEGAEKLTFMDLDMDMIADPDPMVTREGMMRALARMTPAGDRGEDSATVKMLEFKQQLEERKDNKLL